MRNSKVYPVFIIGTKSRINLNTSLQLISFPPMLSVPKLNSDVQGQVIHDRVVGIEQELVIQ